MSAHLAASLHHSWPSVRAFMSSAKSCGAACMTNASRMRLHVASVAAFSSLPCSSSSALPTYTASTEMVSTHQPRH